MGRDWGTWIWDLVVIENLFYLLCCLTWMCFNSNNNNKNGRGIAQKKNTNNKKDIKNSSKMKFCSFILIRNGYQYRIID